MANIRFYPSNEKDGTCNIMLYFRPGNMIFTYSAGDRINLSDWDRKRQRAKNSLPYYEEFNAHLDNLAAVVKKTVFSFRTQGRPLTRADLKKALDQATNKPIPQSATFEQYVKEIAARKQGTTKSNYTRTLTQLKAFAKYKRLTLSFDAFTYDFITAFESYLRKNARTEGNKPLSHSYIHKNLTSLKVILREAYRAGKHTSLAFEAYNIQTKPRRGNTAYLTIQELVTMLNTEFPGHLQKYADLLLLSCLTGQRFSDWKGIPDFSQMAKRFGEVDFAPIWNQKTSKTVWIPLLAPVKAILDKYKGVIPSASMKETNLQFKEVCRYAGINDLVIAPDARGDENPQSATRPKYELVSTKTGRTTVNTLLRDKGCPDHLIGLITGHYGKKAMADVYDRRSEAERLEQLSNYLRLIEREFPSNDIETYWL